jgi:hypothetical protein
MCLQQIRVSQARAYETEDVVIFGDAARHFFERECVPHVERRERAGVVDRDIWTTASAAGLLCAAIPEAYGGTGGKFTSLGSSPVGVPGAAARRRIWITFRAPCRFRRRSVPPKVMQAKSRESFNGSDLGTSRETRGAYDAKRLARHCLRLSEAA